MSTSPPPETIDDASDAAWYVYDRDLNLLHIDASLTEAEAWAVAHWRVVEVAEREQIDAHDYWYLLLAAPDEAGYTSRDFQARILRQDRVIAIGRDPNAPPRYPRHPPT